MEKIKRILPVLLLMLAVLCYTVYNYSTGKIGSTELMVYLVIMAMPLVGMINSIRR